MGVQNSDDIIILFKLVFLYVKVNLTNRKITNSKPQKGESQFLLRHLKVISEIRYIYTLKEKSGKISLESAKIMTSVLVDIFFQTEPKIKSYGI